MTGQAGVISRVKSLMPIKVTERAIKGQGKGRGMAGKTSHLDLHLLNNWKINASLHFFFFF